MADDKIKNISERLQNIFVFENEDYTKTARSDDNTFDGLVSGAKEVKDYAIYLLGEVKKYKSMHDDLMITMTNVSKASIQGNLRIAALEAQVALLTDIIKDALKNG